MFDKFFGKKKEVVEKPRIGSLEVGSSFNLDSLSISLVVKELTVTEIAQQHRILAAGIVDLGDSSLLRFYTDDEAWLQVCHTSEALLENVIDVNLFHYYDTLSVGSDDEWERTLKTVGKATYEVDGKVFTRAWNDASNSEYAAPVAMTETAYDEGDEPDVTDQFAMLYERDIGDGKQELLFVSAEEKAVDDGERFDRCLVLSTGIKLSPAQIDFN
jgi:hypothetical protein